MEIGTAKPTLAERARVPHHLIDIASPDQPCTAGDYSRHAREAIRGITHAAACPSSPAAPASTCARCPTASSPARRATNLCARSSASAPNSRPGPAAPHPHPPRPRRRPLIHANDTPKLIRAIEVTLAARQPITRHGRARDPLTGFRILRLGLSTHPAPSSTPHQPPRRPNVRPAAASSKKPPSSSPVRPRLPPLASLGYAQAAAVLRGELTRDQAIAAAQQGHRNYAKRQLTWFRKDPALHWLPGFGSAPETIQQASALVAHHLNTR